MKILEYYGQTKLRIQNFRAKSAWQRGVKEYALELLIKHEDYYGEVYPSLEQLLNGAQDWKQYSFGGNACIYDGDIAARLCTPSQFERSNEGERRPNARESWLDVQARALSEAADLILRYS